MARHPRTSRPNRRLNLRLPSLRLSVDLSALPGSPIVPARPTIAAKTWHVARLMLPAPRSVLTLAQMGLQVLQPIALQRFRRLTETTPLRQTRPPTLSRLRKLKLLTLELISICLSDVDSYSLQYTSDPRRQWMLQSRSRNMHAPRRCFLQRQQGELRGPMRQALARQRGYFRHMFAYLDDLFHRLRLLSVVSLQRWGM